MSHSTRRPRRQPRAPPSKPKRVQVELDDGWTVITHSTARMRSETRPGRTGPAEAAIAYPTATVRGLTPSKLVAEYEGMRVRWENSECRQALRRTLDARGAVTGRAASFRHAICLATGSFSVDWEGRSRALWQLVFFMGLVDMVSEDAAPPALYAQEPRFNALDEEFLHVLGFTILRGQEAADYVSPDSFLYAPFLQWEVLLPEVLKGTDPQLFVGNDMADMISVLDRDIRKPDMDEASVRSCLQVAESFRSSRDCVAVPPFELHSHALEGLTVYWKQRDGEDDANDEQLAAALAQKINIGD